MNLFFHHHLVFPYMPCVWLLKFGHLLDCRWTWGLFPGLGCYP